MTVGTDPVPERHFWVIDKLTIAAAPPAPPIVVPVDIKPGSCANPVNIKSNGVLPVVVLGTAYVDGTGIDGASIRLAGVAAIRSSLEDAAAPLEAAASAEVDAAACMDPRPDGFMDLNLSFDTPQVVAALGDVNDGDVLVVNLSGKLLDGTPIQGQDVMLILEKGK